MLRLYPEPNHSKHELGSLEHEGRPLHCTRMALVAWTTVHGFPNLVVNNQIRERGDFEVAISSIHGTTLAQDFHDANPKAFTAPFIDSFLTDMDRLGVERPTRRPRTTEHVPEMIGLTRTLISRGFAYEKNGSVYFDVSRYRRCAEFSGVDPGKITNGATVDLDAYEKHGPMDFALFKRAALGEVKRGFATRREWGLCRPGWRLQCPDMMADWRVSANAAAPCRASCLQPQGPPL